MEYQILKLLLNREFYEQTKGILSSKLFSTDIGSIYNTIIYMYNKYTCNSITIEELYNVHLDVNQLTTAKKELLDIVFTKLRATETPNEEIVRDLIQSMYRRNMYIEITELCARGINEGTDVAERLRAVLSTDVLGHEVMASYYPSDL